MPSFRYQPLISLASGLRAAKFRGVKLDPDRHKNEIKAINASRPKPAPGIDNEPGRSVKDRLKEFEATNKAKDKQIAAVHEKEKKIAEFREKFNSVARDPRGPGRSL